MIQFFVTEIPVLLLQPYLAFSAEDPLTVAPFRGALWRLSDHWTDLWPQDNPSIIRCRVLNSWTGWVSWENTLCRVSVGSYALDLGLVCGCVPAQRQAWIQCVANLPYRAPCLGDGARRLIQLSASFGVKGWPSSPVHAYVWPCSSVDVTFDCLLASWLPLGNVLFVILDISHYPWLHKRVYFELMVSMTSSLFLFLPRQEDRRRSKDKDYQYDRKQKRNSKKVAQIQVS